MTAGIVLDYQLGISTSIWICIFAPAAAIYFTAEIIYQNKLKSNAYNLALICYLLMLVSFGGTWHSMFDYRERPVEAEVLNTYTWENLTISGTVRQIKQTSTGKYQIDVWADGTLFPADISWQKSYKLRAVMDPDDLSFPANLNLGDRITFLATIYPLEGNAILTISTINNIWPRKESTLRLASGKSTTLNRILIHSAGQKFANRFLMLSTKILILKQHHLQKPYSSDIKTNWIVNRKSPFPELDFPTSWLFRVFMWDLSWLRFGL
jgi:hypothetical protein